MLKATRVRKLALALALAAFPASADQLTQVGASGGDKARGAGCAGTGLKFNTACNSQYIVIGMVL